MTNFDLSLVICVYNGEKYIVDTLKSIERQSMKEFNLLIIDDCSNDKTLEVLETYSSTSMLASIKIISLDKNSGLANARSIAEQLVTTKYMMFIDADDILKENMVKKFLDKIRSDKDLIAVGCYVEYINALGKKIGGGIFVGDTTKELFWERARKNKLIFMPACAIFDREAALSVGGRSIVGFPEGKPRYQDMCEDLDLWTRMSDLYIEGKAIIVLPEVLYQYRKLGNSVSANTTAMMLRMKHIKYNLLQRRFGKEELTFSEYIESLSLNSRRALEKMGNAASIFTQGGIAYSNKKYGVAIIKLVYSFIISPKYSIDKIKSMIKIKK